GDGWDIRVTALRVSGDWLGCQFDWLGCHLDWLGWVTGWDQFDSPPYRLGCFSWTVDISIDWLVVRWDGWDNISLMRWGVQGLAWDIRELGLGLSG
ncbi:Hypothetical predicted protein, partial [Mytilus galloprovincialis]